MKPQFMRPIAYGRGKMTSPYGPRDNHFHAGLDIGGVPVGEPVLAAMDGLVRFADTKQSIRDPNGYGNQIIIQHPNGLYTQYAHLNTVEVKTGDKVKAGQRIGGVGRSGHSSGPHLHFEVRKEFTYAGRQNNTLDPLPLIMTEAQWALSQRYGTKVPPEEINNEPTFEDGLKKK